MATLTSSSVGERVLIDLTKATRDALGDRSLLTAERAGKSTAFKPEYVVIAASDKNVLPLGGREFSVHTAVFRGQNDYIFLEGSYGLTLDKAYAEYVTRTSK